MKQRLIAENEWWPWQRALSEYLNGGWTIVPGTLQILMQEKDHYMYERYVAVVQKADEPSELSTIKPL